MFAEANSTQAVSHKPAPAQARAFERAGLPATKLLAFCGIFDVSALRRDTAGTAAATQAQGGNSESHLSGLQYYAIELTISTGRAEITPVTPEQTAEILLLSEQGLDRNTISERVGVTPG